LPQQKSVLSLLILPFAQLHVLLHRVDNHLHRINVPIHTQCSATLLPALKLCAGGSSTLFEAVSGDSLDGGLKLLLRDLLLHPLTHLLGLFG